MHKFLSILGSLSLTVVASATVVSCGAKINPITVKVGNDDYSENGLKFSWDDKNSYSLADLGSITTAYPEFYAFGNNVSQLLNPISSRASVNDDIYNVLTSVGRKIVKKTQLESTREIFAGREDYEKRGKEVEESSQYLRPSVDGLLLNWENKEEYYRSFETTSINSIEGLYNLSKYEKTADIGPGLTAAKAMADQAFASDEAKEFADLFVGLKQNPYHEAAFTRIAINQGISAKDMFDRYQTQAASFDLEGLTSSSTEIPIIESGLYKTVNKFTAEEIQKDEENKLHLRKTDPSGRLVLKGTTMPTAPTKLVLLPPIEKDQKLQSLIQLQDSSTIYLVNNTKSDDKKATIQQVSQAYYQPVGPLDMEYDFKTGIRKKEQGDTYTLKFKINNLSAVWVPFIPTKPIKVPDGTDDNGKEKTKDLTQIVWHFAGYKFSNGLSADLQGYAPNRSDEDHKKITFEKNHRFQDFVLSDLTITKQN